MSVLLRRLFHTPRRLGVTCARGLGRGVRAGAERRLCERSAQASLPHAAAVARVPPFRPNEPKSDSVERRAAGATGRSVGVYGERDAKRRVGFRSSKFGMCAVTEKREPDPENIVAFWGGNAGCSNMTLPVVG